MTPAEAAGRHGARVEGRARAVANALFALTGRRVRRLPIRPADLRG